MVISGVPFSRLKKKEAMYLLLSFYVLLTILILLVSQESNPYPVPWRRRDYTMKNGSGNQAPQLHKALVLCLDQSLQAYLNYIIGDIFNDLTFIMKSEDLHFYTEQNHPEEMYVWGSYIFGYGTI